MSTEFLCYNVKGKHHNQLITWKSSESMTNSKIGLFPGKVQSHMDSVCGIPIVINSSMNGFFPAAAAPTRTNTKQIFTIWTHIQTGRSNSIVRFKYRLYRDPLFQVPNDNQRILSGITGGRPLPIDTDTICSNFVSLHFMYGWMDQNRALAKALIVFFLTCPCSNFWLLLW